MARMYDIYAVNERNPANRVKMTAYAMLHEQACVMKNKINNNVKGRRIELVEVVPFQPKELCNIPSGMGGHFTALVLNNDGENVQVYCCDVEFYPLWLLTVKLDDVKPYDGIGDNKMITKARRLAEVI